MNVKRTPGASGRRFAAAASAASDAAMLWERLFRAGSSGSPLREGRGGGVRVSDSLSPVMMLHVRRTKAERHNIVRYIRAGRECQVRMMVPTVNTTRFVVMIRRGGSVSSTHKGVIRRIRIKRVV